MLIAHSIMVGMIEMYIVRPAGMHIHAVVKTTVLLSDMKDYPAFNEVYSNCK